MTSSAGPATGDREAVAAEDGAAAPVPEQVGPLYYLGFRRGWWVVLCVVLLSAVDALPTIGPYLALAVLMWMAAGLAKAAPRPERSRARLARPVGRRSRSSRSRSGSAVPSS